MRSLSHALIFFAAFVCVTYARLAFSTWPRNAEGFLQGENRFKHNRSLSRRGLAACTCLLALFVAEFMLPLPVWLMLLVNAALFLASIAMTLRLPFTEPPQAMK